MHTRAFVEGVVFEALCLDPSVALLVHELKILVVFEARLRMIIIM